MADESKLLNFLVKKGIIRSEQVDEVLKEYHKYEENGQSGINISQVLINKGYVSFEQLNEQLLKLDEDIKQTFKEHEKYRIIEKIGEGGMGIVYKALDTQLNRNAALKFLDKISGERLKRFLNEAEIISKLTHPNIVPVYDIGSLDEQYYISMQYVDGKTLDHFIGKSSEKEFVEIILKVCDALKYAHLKGVIHRDIKPQNIIVADNKSVYVTDFGLAKHSDNDLTVTGEMLGTPAFMSPEQCLGKNVDVRSDIYSLGITLYNCFVGRLPFDGDSTGAVIIKIIEGKAIPIKSINSKIHKDLQLIVEKCIFLDPKLRYQSVGELEDDLKRFLNGERVRVKGLPFWYVLIRKAKKYRIHAIIGLIIVILSLLYAFSLYSISRKEKLSKELMYKGLQHRANKQYGEAVKLLKDAVESCPTNFEAHYALASILFDEDKYDEAVISLNEVIKLNPDFAASYYLLGASYYKLNRSKEAETELLKALKLNSNHANSYHCLGNVYIKLGLYEESIVSLKKGSQLDRGNPEIINSLGVAFKSKNNFDEALKYFAAAVKISPDVALFHKNLGLVYLQMGNANDAVISLNRAIRLDPKDYSTVYQAGIAHVQLNNKELAIEQYKSLIKTDGELARKLRSIIDDAFKKNERF
ncbi:MAG: tetratricopeptide repeat protein [Planctomycetes bacterium]|nr:tetratricopeptide repeat protein [Planctomycetota bacterium]